MMLPRLVDPAPGDSLSRADPLPSLRSRRRDGPGAGNDAAQPPPLHLLRYDAHRPADAGDARLPEVDGQGFAPRRLHAGRRVFVQGQAFDHLHSVHAGSFKTVIVLPDGREQVSQFCFTGDLMGLDGLGGGIHASTATALEDSVVFEVPVTSLCDAAVPSKPWHEVLYCHMSREIVREHAQMLLLGSMGAFARLATFLLELSDRMAVRGFSPLDFHLRMTRCDIGSYLGLSMETVSRMFSTLQQHGVIHVDRRHVVIRSPGQLRELRDRNSA
ncbi:helix-turn-helix domain-containing protein [Ramlibacter sp. AN1133]|uniref:helix-turn-helix domain-containing protein n=1 Tax=Ramlibacter sp. AN1133 TaxID=3133429 RepID=UPI0030C57293